MQEEIVVVVVKRDNLYIELFSGTEEQLSNIRDYIYKIFENEEIKEINISKDEYITAKSNIDELQKLYAK